MIKYYYISFFVISFVYETLWSFETKKYEAGNLGRHISFGANRVLLWNSGLTLDGARGEYQGLYQFILVVVFSLFLHFWRRWFLQTLANGDFCGKKIIQKIIITDKHVKLRPEKLKNLKKVRSDPPPYWTMDQIPKRTFQKLYQYSESKTIILFYS